MSKVFIDTTLVDGFADGPHITEEQVGIANQGLYGPNDYVLDEGKKSKAEILTNNSIRIFDATYVIQGRRDVIAANDYTDVNIDNGSQGMNRNDIIVRRYEKDESSEIEKTSYAVIKGTPTSGTASDPEITTGVIRNGDTLHEMKLYRVKLNGLNIVAVEPLFDVLMNMSTINKSLSDNVSELGDSYIKFANGFLLQWGITTHDKVKLATSSVNLQVPYRDAGYRVSLTPGRNGNLIEKLWVGDSGGNNNQRTPNHFNVSSQAEQVSYDRAIEWATFGRWK